MKNIVFGITDLSTGGAEKTLVDLCNRLIDNYNITIFTIYGNGNLARKLSRKIKVVSLHKKGFNDFGYIKRKIISFKLFFSKKAIYEKYIKNKYETEVAFLEGPITSLFSIPNNTVKKIAWVHTDIGKIFGNGLKAWIKKMINNKIYVNYNELIFVSDDSLNNFNKEYKNNVKKRVINNYINIDNILNSAKENMSLKFENNVVNFLSVSRLVEAKAIDRLIKVHSKLVRKGLKHKIYIIGNRTFKRIFK